MLGYRPCARERTFLELATRREVKKVDRVIARHIERWLSTPAPLSSLARNAIRGVLRTRLSHKVGQLGLPRLLERSICLLDADDV